MNARPITARVWTKNKYISKIIPPEHVSISGEIVFISSFFTLRWRGGSPWSTGVYAHGQRCPVSSLPHQCCVIRTSCSSYFPHGGESASACLACSPLLPFLDWKAHSQISAQALWVCGIRTYPRLTCLPTLQQTTFFIYSSLLWYISRGGVCHTLTSWWQIQFQIFEILKLFTFRSRMHSRIPFGILECILMHALLFFVKSTCDLLLLASVTIFEGSDGGPTPQRLEARTLNW